MSTRGTMVLARERERKVWELACTGRSQLEIADALGISQPSVSRSLRRAYDRATQETTERIAQFRALQHGRLERVYREAIDGFERSKEPQKRSKHEAKTSAGNPAFLQTATKHEAKTSAGNPAFLQTAIGALTEINRLHGLVAPTKLAITAVKGRPLEDLSDEELRQRLAADAAELAGMGD